MNMQSLSEKQRLKAKKAIEVLFGKSHVYGKYPLRILWNIASEESEEAGLKLLVAVPKRRVKKAVQRNRIKRLIREVYRKNKNEADSFFKEKRMECHLGILFIGEPLPTFENINGCLTDLLKRLPLEYEKHI
jgi:ribonuclease P protein component